MGLPRPEALEAIERSERSHPLARVLDRVQGHLSFFGHRLTASDGRLDDLYVSLAEVRRTLRRGPKPESEHFGPPPATLAPRPPALERLGETFGLDEVERELLLLAAAPGLDRDIARLYTFAWGDFTLRMPTVGFLAELAEPEPLAREAVIAALRPDRALVRHRLLRLHATEHWRPAPPLLHHGVAVPEPVLARLRGQPILLDAHGVCRLTPPDPPGPGGVSRRLAFPAGARRQIERAWHGTRRGGPPLVLTGPPGSGRRTLLQTLDDGPLLVADPSRAPAEIWPDVLADATREARAEGAALLVRADGLSDEDAEHLARALRRAMGDDPVPLAITTRRTIGPLRRALGTLRVIDVPALDAAEQRALWLAELADDRPERARRLADAFSVPPGAIVETAAEARRQAAEEPADDAEGEAPCAVDPCPIDPCVTLLRTRIEHALDAVADPVTTTLTWADVVLPPDVVEALDEIRTQARHRSQVFDTWGFRRKMDYGRGLACLFAGPPGTGKTMMAGIIAGELGRPLYRVDLSRIVSKWVGETEKNLARVFDEAESAQVILFFDEADSLFSTRTEVKGANDRFANMEVNYLLQRMEQYDGISILTTNFERSIDDAFKRRLRFRVHFPLPDAEQRSLLWQRMVPDAMAVDDDIGWARLGKAYKFSGGSIKNAVLRAAFYAAEGEGVLTQALMDKAAEAERREMGRL